MRAYSNEATRSFEPTVVATRWSWWKRRIRFRLRSFGRVAGSCMSGLIGALHDSRSRSATRLIAQYGHLIQDDHCADCEGPEMRPSDFAER